MIEHRAQIELSKRLVALDENMDLPFTLESLEIRDAVAEDLLEFLNQIEFRTLTKRIADRMGVEPPAAPEITAPDAPEAPEAPAMGTGTYTCIRDTQTLAKWIAQAHARGYVSVDTETTGLNEMTADLVGVSLCIEAG